MARRRLGTEKLSEQPTVPMTRGLLVVLERLAEQDNITRSELMRRLLQEGVDRRMGEQNEQRQQFA